MNNPTSATMSRYDYWVLRFFRDASAIFLFVAAPVVQLALSRWIPFALLIALVLLLLGHSLTRFRYVDFSIFKRVLEGRAKWVMLAWAAFVSWGLISVLWSPLPQEGLKDVVALTALLPLALLLASEQSRSILIPFRWLVMAGALLSAALLISEFLRFTSVYNFADNDALFFDLNRNVIALLLVSLSLILLTENRGPFFFAKGVLVALLLLVLWHTQSQTAQLAALCSFIAVAACTRIKRMTRYVFCGAAVVIIVLPISLTQLKSITENSNSDWIKESNAFHRVIIWEGYSERIADKPLFGWGAKGDRELGRSGAIGEHLDHAGFSETPTHPHNFIMEIWINQGLVGVVFFVAFLCALGEYARNLPDRQRLAAVCLFVAAFVCAAAGASWLQGWFLAAILCALVATFGISQEPLHSKST